MIDRSKKIISTKTDKKQISDKISVFKANITEKGFNSQQYTSEALPTKDFQKTVTYYNWKSITLLGL
jgi:hypothetical protein